MRRRGLRRLHGGARRTRRGRPDDLPRHQQLHRPPAHVRGPGDRHRGGPGAWRDAPPRAGAHGGAVRLAVRLLHARASSCPCSRRTTAGTARAPRELSDQLSGNLCRCTGYRPIRDAALGALAERGAHPAADGPLRAARLAGPRGAVPALDYEAEGCRFLRPASLRQPPGRAGRQIPRPASLPAPPRSAWTSRRSPPRSRSSSPPRAFPSSRGSRARRRRGGSAERRRSPTSRRPWPPSTRPWQDAARLRLPRHPQQGDHGRQPRHRVADRRQRAGAAHAGCVRGPCRPPGRAHGGPRRLLPRLPQDRPAARGDHQRDRPAVRHASAGASRGALDFLKVSKRRELDISIVAGAFRVGPRREGRRAGRARWPTAAWPSRRGGRGRRRRRWRGDSWTGPRAAVAATAARRVPAHRRRARQRRVPPAGSS